MKKYDFKKAKEIIIQESKNGLLYAKMGMREDWTWTEEEVWNKEDLFSMNFYEEKIASISGSSWATPMLALYYEKEYMDLDMFIEKESNTSKEEIEKMKNFAKETGGADTFK